MKSFGFGKKNLYLGLAFLVVVGLLSLFVFTGARKEGFYAYITGYGSTVMDTKTLNSTASNDRKTSDKTEKETS